MTRFSRRATHATHVRRCARVLLCTVTASGCYRYAAIDNATPPAVGSELRVHLSDGGSVALAPYVGARVALLDGRLMNTSDTGYVFAVSGTTTQIGSSVVWTGERVVVPTSAIARVERRKLDKRRTFLAGGLVAIAAALAGKAFSLIGGGGDSGGSAPPPPPPA